MNGPPLEHPFAALVGERGIDAELRWGEEIWPPVARIAAGPAQKFVLTAGFVGGREGEGSREIPAGLVARVLDAALAGQVAWEADPDFGWELPMEVPGVSYEERLVLVPRFLYARTDRPYDYAALVPEAKAAS